MTDYSYAQLEGLWIQAGGPRNMAPTMAAIAEAESGGNSDAHNPSGASGLWQILGNPFPGNPFDPATNARMAVAKYKSQGLGAWVTYTSGAYKAYLNNSTTPDGNVPGSPSAQTTAAITGSQSDCLVPNPLSISVPVVGSVGGPACLFSKSNARAFIGAGILVAGGMVGLAGLLVAVAAFGVKAAGPLGGVAEGVGGAMLLVPGLEGAGAAVGAAGRVARNPAREGRARQKRQAAEEKEYERKFGAKENPDLEVRGGVVRENAQQKAARQRRQQGAARARARQAARPRAAGEDEPPF